MSYQVLARKWRPANFAQVVGQSHVLHALTNALGQQRLHHAYLFTGTRGVGKTSLARLFAKGLNCETGITANPCGQCSACREIAEGRFVDLIEVDAASRTKVDDTREILDNVQYRPSRGRFKVYLIDEVHMLSKSSFNALLKTLEEPPEHVKFLLATTDPQKLPVTVLSRCLQFNLKALTQEQIQQQLAAVLGGEDVGFDEPALQLLAKAAAGSMRDALSLTDQAIAFGAGEVRLEQVQTMLGAIDKGQIAALFDALCQGEIEPLLSSARSALGFGADADEVLRALLELLHQISLAQFAPATAQVSDNTEVVLAWAQALKPEQVQLFYQILLAGRKDLAFAPTPAIGLEMTLLRAVGFVPEKPVKTWQAGAGLPQVASLPAAVPAAAIAATSATVSEAVVTPAAVEPVIPALDAEPPKKPVVAVVSDDNPPPQVNQQSLQANKPSPQVDNSAGEEAKAADKPDADITPPSTDADTHDEAALVAEQTLLMSQAESQGFVGYGEAVDYAEYDNGSLFASGSHDYEAFASGEDLFAEPGQSSQVLTEPEPEPEPEQTEPAVQPQNSAAGTSTAPGPATDPSPAIAPTPEAGPAASGQAGAAAFGDDILDAVLAARDDLLAGLSEEAKEDESKKSPGSFARRQLATAKASADSATAAESTQAPEPAATEPTATAQNVDAADASQAHARQAVSAIDDRPPWEEPIKVTEAPAQQAAVAESDAEVKDASSAEGKAAAAYIAPSVQTSPEQAYTQLPEPTAEPEPVPQPGSAAQPEPAPLQAAAAEPQIAAVVQAPPQLQPRPQPQPQPQQLSAVSDDAISGDETDLRWYKLMGALEIGGRVRQLAVNSVCLEWANPIPLVLKQDQKHLAAPVAIEQLNEALSNALGHPAWIALEVGEVPGRETPLDIRGRFHQELLRNAKNALGTDAVAQRLMQQAGAWIDEDSISYPQDRLAARGRALPQPPALAETQDEIASS
ncbi:DNA polymerase III subunit gamma/tau [Shewanella sp. 3B26]|uniref:DNA-directed DNA polymerase n=1 Tax=Shewanella zhuhaiensis TaxID=2919576 RepID=A0AAJ1FA57_9GAMM|nr:DNA polymerase III subunit gamma/tau [Shewanella zhuhaiensis]MCH4293735.1 DNA polymerase III subunit gamma/tau [Shewanella zhuhaiensis]